MSFTSEFQLGLERYIPGRSSKLTQGAGPFVINFKKPNTRVVTYLQIDGEFFKISNPKSIKVSKTNKFEGSKINVMVKR